MKAVPAKRKPESASLRHALHGLALPASVLRALQKRGIYCTPGVSLEHQHLAKRYVLRGVESGGALPDMGRACAFVSPEGDPLPWLQSLDSIAVNGRHAIFLAESLVRVEMLRLSLIHIYMLSFEGCEDQFTSEKFDRAFSEYDLFRLVDQPGLLLSDCLLYTSSSTSTTCW